jgi:predicted nucleic acid-binding protein
VSEAADFEVRREILRLIKSGRIPASRIDRLNRLVATFNFFPIVTAHWRRAAEFWADVRIQGLPTAGSEALDADASIAAQAADLGATVVSSNAAHIGRWAPVRLWP